MHPGFGGEHAVARWTAPATGAYTISARFTGYDSGGPHNGTTTDVLINENSSINLLHGAVNGSGNSVQYQPDTPLQLSKGDTLDFIVGFGSDGDASNDNTGVSVRIDSAPTVNTTPDPAFGSAGAVTTPFASTEVTAQPDGKVLVVGSAASAKGNYTNFTLARYTAAGALDFSSAADFGASARATGAFVQADGKIVVAGVETVAGKARLAVARFTAAGVLDPTFGAKGRALGPAASVSVSSNFTVAVQADGKVVVGNRAASSFSLSRYVVGSGGVLSLDPAFGSGGNVTTAFPAGNSAVGRVTLQPDGKIIAAGVQGANVAVARYNPDGSLDSSFASGGLATAAVASLQAVTDVRVNADGTITALGYLPPLTSKSTGVRPVLARFTAAGTLDTTFGSGGTLSGSLRLSPDAVNAAYLCLAFDGRLFELDNHTVLKRLIGQADVTPPTAAVSKHLPQPTAGARTYSFAVSYNDDRGLDVSTIGAGDVTVSGGKFSATAKFLAATPGSGNHEIATYSFTAPGGRWSAADDGSYTITLNRRQVRDLSGNAAPAQVLGTLRVALPKAAAANAPLAATAAGGEVVGGVAPSPSFTPFATGPDLVAREADQEKSPWEA